ncbi:prepilin peptidase [Thermovenabulum gondwanense]|uniref:Type 4 prepilin-like proteins leader peptide-processing enzyme n=1 Tax=Thermovenabulum gondwanense TaxID=520767 RepID=A0A162MH36_9FIRM|nr:A24 family peptidase [Thermovenabulum gondwanense]KYO65838.1 Type 4 prepilin-like proteins leader peptide-processing enzyme [Thermovenabulum gondwanense]
MLFSFILGAIIGSFINVVVYRVPQKMSIVYPSSHCPFCKKRLEVFELIPVVSFLLQKGRCRNCGERIPIRYFFIELLTGILFTLLFFKFGYNLSFIKFALFVSVLLSLTFIDLEHYILPDEIIIFGLVCGIIFVFIEKNFYTSLLGGLIGFTFMAVIFLLSRGGMGGGDVKLALLIGLFTGIRFILLSILTSFVVGAFIGIILIFIKRKNLKDPIPFGPFLSLGAIFSILFGEELLKYYFNLFK